MQAFDNELYTKLQTEEILNRINKFNGKLYLEFGGKLFDDYNASRVLPGFKPDSKLKVLSTLKDQTEILFVVSAKDLEKNKIRADSNLNYGLDCLRIIDNLRELGLYVSSIIITQYSGQKKADEFKQFISSRGEKVYIHTLTKGYPDDLDTIVSEEGYGANPYIKTSRPLVVVTATGPASGKLATCLSQLYHEFKRGNKAGYAKYETFPVWSLDLKDPINISYEAATADIGDVNKTDSFHEKAYGIKATNYNRDLAVFPVLKKIFEKIFDGTDMIDFYKSPTDMGVNKVGFAIADKSKCDEAARREVIRRYQKAKTDYKKGLCNLETLSRIEQLMKELNADISERKVVKLANDLSDKRNLPAVCLELHTGKCVCGVEKDLLSASSACVLNALKSLAEIDDDVLLLPKNILESVINLKKQYFGHNVKNTVLTLKESLIILSIAAEKDVKAKMALSKLSALAYTEAHASFILRDDDENMLKKLLINITNEDKYFGKNLFLK